MTSHNVIDGILRGDVAWDSIIHTPTAAHLDANPIELVQRLS